MFNVIDSPIHLFCRIQCENKIICRGVVFSLYPPSYTRLGGRRRGGGAEFEKQVLGQGASLCDDINSEV